jgi:hypothetical protein
LNSSEYTKIIVTFKKNLQEDGFLVQFLYYENLAYFNRYSIKSYKIKKLNRNLEGHDHDHDPMTKKAPVAHTNTCNEI